MGTDSSMSLEPNADRIRERLYRAHVLHRDDPDFSEARIVLGLFVDEAEALLAAARGTAAERIVATFRADLARAHKDAVLEIAGRLS